MIKQQKACQTCKHCLHIPPEIDYEDGHYCCMLGASKKERRYVIDEFSILTDGFFYLPDFCYDNFKRFSSKFMRIMLLENCANFDEGGRAVNNLECCQFYKEKKWK